jgi:GNAT superfamily N-acetyltransferase
MQGYRELTLQGLGGWWGASLDGRLVGDLGLFLQDGVGCCQPVGTHPESRQQGIYGTLIHEMARRALSAGRAETLVMVADPDYHAACIYESVGFVATEQQVGICWWDRQIWGADQQLSVACH